jgi:hypothetical protein
LETGASFVKVGVLIGGETSVRAAHSLSADPLVDELVVIGPATSHNFKVVQSAAGLDVLVGSGSRAPAEARRHQTPLVWDGNHSADGVAIWGASLLGIAAAIARRHRNATMVAAAHPDAAQASGVSVRFARPVGATQVDEVPLDGTSVALGKSYNDYAACLVATRKRQITVVDRAVFIQGIALAAGVAVFGDEPRPVWDEALRYLETATGMGLQMAQAEA